MRVKWREGGREEGKKGRRYMAKKRSRVEGIKERQKGRMYEDTQHTHTHKF